MGEREREKWARAEVYEPAAAAFNFYLGFDQVIIDGSFASLPHPSIRTYVYLQPTRILVLDKTSITPGKKIKSLSHPTPLFDWCYKQCWQIADKTK